MIAIESPEVAGVIAACGGILALCLKWALDVMRARREPSAIGNGSSHGLSRDQIREIVNAECPYLKDQKFILDGLKDLGHEQKRLVRDVERVITSQADQNRRLAGIEQKLDRVLERRH